MTILEEGFTWSIYDLETLWRVAILFVYLDFIFIFENDFLAINPSPVAESLQIFFSYVAYWYFHVFSMSLGS